MQTLSCEEYTRSRLLWNSSISIQNEISGIVSLLLYTVLNASVYTLSGFPSKCRSIKVSMSRREYGMVLYMKFITSFLSYHESGMEHMELWCIQKNAESNYQIRVSYHNFLESKSILTPLPLASDMKYRERISHFNFHFAEATQMKNSDTLHTNVIFETEQLLNEVRSLIS